jgi:type I restriction enzyme S subunit
MSNKDKAPLLPKLRFPEFRETDAWRSKELGSVCEILNNQRRPITGSDREPGPYPYYGASGVVDFVKDFIFDERLLLVGEDGAKWNAFDKTAFIVDGKYWVNNHAHVLKPTEINDTLLENYLTMADLGPFVTGAAPPKLTLGKLKSIPVPVPPSGIEQQKIADCLSSLDELIAAQARKVDALKTHKKGLIQQLFPGQGETQPRLRFPEFGEPWVESKLEDLCGSVSSGRDQIDSDGLFDLYGSTSVIGKTKNASFNGERILVARVGANAGMLTKAKGSFGVTDNTLVVSPNNSIDIDFLFHYLGSININKLIFGSGQPLITGSILKNLPIQVPVDAEQRRVSACLSLLDELIIAQSSELEAFKTHKRGLMQQLFPATAEDKA